MAIYRAIGTDDERSFEIDDNTALWAARMCVGEGGVNCSGEKVSAMMWALANRYLLHPGRKHWPSFLYMMRRFSQPINPRWQFGGDLAIRNIGKPSASPARLRRREKICRLKRPQISGVIHTVIGNFARGEIAPPSWVEQMEHPRISNWASYRGVKYKYPHGIDIDGDWFLEDKRLNDGVVVVDHWSGK